MHFYRKVKTYLFYVEKLLNFKKKNNCKRNAKIYFKVRSTFCIYGCSFFNEKDFTYQRGLCHKFVTKQYKNKSDKNIKKIQKH